MNEFTSASTGFVNFASMSVDPSTIIRIKLWNTKVVFEELEGSQLPVKTLCRITAKAVAKSKKKILTFL